MLHEDLELVLWGNDNLCGKLISTLELPIMFNDSLIITSV